MSAVEPTAKPIYRYLAVSLNDDTGHSRWNDAL